MDVPPPTRGRERPSKQPSGLLPRTACGSRTSAAKAGVLGILYDISDYLKNLSTSFTASGRANTATLSYACMCVSPTAI